MLQTLGCAWSCSRVFFEELSRQIHCVQTLFHVLRCLSQNGQCFIPTQAKQIAAPEGLLKDSDHDQGDGLDILFFQLFSDAIFKQLGRLLKSSPNYIDFLLL